MKTNSLLLLFLFTICFSCSNVERKFIGSWKFLELIPNDKPDDHSMNGYIISIEKLPNSDKSYVLHFSGQETILTEENEYKLVGQNSNVYVTFDPKTSHLSFFLSKDFEIVLTKIE